MEWRIGCSGFYYREWKEIFYPAGLPQKSWFEYYCQHFNTLEINSTFYKMPTLKAFNNWYNQSPPDFLFTVKAPRLITHYKKFNEVTSLVTDFYSTIKEGLREKVGCVLFQLPPSYSFSKERLDAVLGQMNPGFNNVMEFRHESWWTAEVFKALSAQQITFSGISYPSSLPDQVIENTSLVYYRFHGKPVLYKSLYSLEEIKAFVAQLPPGDRQVYVYFNNTWGNSALINSRQLQEITGTNLKISHKSPQTTLF